MAGDNDLSRANAETPRIRERLAQVERENERLRKLLASHERALSVNSVSLGLLHDINNAVACVLGLNALARDAHDEERETLRAGVEHEAWRVAHLAKDLLQLGRAPTDAGSAGEAIEFDAQVQRFGRSYSRLLAGTATKFSMHCGAGRACTKIDAIEIGRVISNLISNARDALGTTGSGEISLQTRLVDLPPNRAAQLRIPSGSFIELSVSDTGRGIPSRDLKRVFEPFYSTKTTGTGTGLGLAVVHEIVRNTKGAIDVSSDPGRGTRIDLLLPACDAPEPSEAAAVAPIDGRDEGLRSEVEPTAHILLIESDPRLRATWASALQVHGYRVDAVDESLARRLFATAELSADLPTWDLVVDDVSVSCESLGPVPRIMTNGDGRSNDRSTLTRPFGPAELLQLVAATVRGTVRD